MSSRSACRRTRRTSATRTSSAAPGRRRRSHVLERARGRREAPPLTPPERGALEAVLRGRFAVLGGRHAELPAERLGELGGLVVADGERDLADGLPRIGAQGRGRGAEPRAQVLAAGVAGVGERTLERAPRGEDA